MRFPSGNTRPTTFARALTVAALMAALNLLSGCGPSAPPEDLAEQYLRLSGVDEQVEGTLEAIQNSMVQNFQQSGAPPEAKPVFDKYMAEVEPLMQSVMSWENTKSDYVGIVEESFTPEELQELVKFYDSPVGQKVSTEMPNLLRKAGELSRQRFEEVRPQMDQLTETMMNDVRAVIAERQGGAAK